jgi:hypothetical protein
MVNACLKCCCGVGCAACWIFIGVWAFFFLGILALLFKLHKSGNIGHFKFEDSENATVLLVTWIIYLALTVFCAFNLKYRLANPWPEETEVPTKDGFTVLAEEEPVSEAGNVAP